MSCARVIQIQPDHWLLQREWGVLCGVRRAPPSALSAVVLLFRRLNIPYRAVVVNCESAVQRLLSSTTSPERSWPLAHVILRRQRHLRVIEERTVHFVLIGYECHGRNQYTEALTVITI
ncbi:hypothetical protein KCP71_24125 [Salmonella enterica subsp. enterica]|nr:hypothetical protein KCP71_24125 [Salmonella enterica subsp. enterica]